MLYNILSVGYLNLSYGIGKNRVFLNLHRLLKRIRLIYKLLDQKLTILATLVNNYE